jgi:hypothetical protein
MYDLTVDEAHTFFVGEEEWLVHNQSCTFAEFYARHSDEIRTNSRMINRDDYGLSELEVLSMSSWLHYELTVDAKMDLFTIAAAAYKRGTGLGIHFTMNGGSFSKQRWMYSNELLRSIDIDILPGLSNEGITDMKLYQGGRASFTFPAKNYNHAESYIRAFGSHHVCADVCITDSVYSMRLIFGSRKYLNDIC